MRIDIHTCGAVDVLRVSGEMQGSGPRRRLREEFARLLEGDEFVFVLDLADARGGDSGFVGELIACRERVRKRGGWVKLVAGDALVDLLVEARLDNLFQIFHEQRDALESFSPVSETAGIP